jgi:hypothetical protein
MAETTAAVDSVGSARASTPGHGLSSHASAAPFALSAAQVEHFHTFGFVALPGLFRADAPLLIEGFEEVFSRDQPQLLDAANPFHEANDERYRDEVRWIIPAFIDRSPKLSWLRDDPRIVGIASGLLGDDHVYAESDGNLFNCDVYWHLDAYGAAAGRTHIKMYFYLDDLDRDTGALRVIPGSHLRQGPYAKALRRLLTVDPSTVPDRLGVALADVPSWTLAVEPGDLLVGDFRTLHGSFGGGARRRLFTVNFGAAEGAEGDT